MVFIPCKDEWQVQKPTHGQPSTYHYLQSRLFRCITTDISLCENEDDDEQIRLTA